MEYYFEPEKKLPVTHFDVVIAGAGTGGVIAAIAAARNGAKTMVIETKGYAGGIAVEGGTALHSFFNLWKPFGVEKRQLVRGIPSELIDNLMKVGGCSGHAETTAGYDYDCVNTGIDTEKYKVVALEMMQEAGVHCMMNTLIAGAVVDDGTLKGVIIENRGGRQVIMAKSFVDATGHGDLCAYAGADFTEPADYHSANSFGMGGVDVEKFYEFLCDHNSIGDVAYGMRSGEPGKLVRVTGGEVGGKVTDASNPKRLPAEFLEKSKEIGLSLVTTTVHDNYFMFVKLNYHIGGASTDMELVNHGEAELRRRQAAAVELFRKYVPGCEKAFIARTAPSILPRRGRCITCDYDMPLDEILNGMHYEDDVYSYGFHDCAPRLQVKNGGSYGLPYRALCVKDINNLYATGMMITSEHDAHMSTRNTVSCMAMGQAAGTAAALCAVNDFDSRQLPYAKLKEALLAGGVYLEND